MRSGEQTRVVELDLVGEDVAVDVRRDGEVSLADVLADSCPRDTGKVQEQDTPERAHIGAIQVALSPRTAPGKRL